MRIWTLVFVSVASMLALFGGAASGDALWVTARVVLLVALAVVLLAAIRGLVLRMASPWDDSARHHLLRARSLRPCGNGGRVAHLPGSNLDRHHPVVSSRTPRSVGEGGTL